MSIDAIRKQLTAARRGDGKVDPKELDKIMLGVRDAGGLEPAERAELIKAADGFNDDTKQRLLRHLASMGQKNAWVNLAAPSARVSTVEGRYASISTGITGLTAKVGFFDSAYALEGKAKKDGILRLQVEGKEIALPVKKGDTAAAVLTMLQGQLSPAVKGVVLSGGVQPFEMASFKGMEARPDETRAHLVLYKPEALGLLPGEKPLRVVVTGYGAFMGITDNPSAAMAQKLAEQGIKGAVVEYRRLDVNHDAVNAFIAEMKQAPPDVILSMGVSSHSQVEERPENKVGGGVDGDNKPITPGVVRTGGKDELKTDLPLEAINAGLAGFGAARVVGSSASDPYYQPDRSAYLCNFLGYNLADSFGASARTTAGFIHVTESTPQDQMHAVLEAVAARQADVRRTLPPTS